MTWKEGRSCTNTRSLCCLFHPSCGLHTPTNAAPHRGLSRHCSRQDFPGLLGTPEGGPHPARGRSGALTAAALLKHTSKGWVCKRPAETVEEWNQTRMWKAGTKILRPGNEAPQSADAAGRTALALGATALSLPCSSVWSGPSGSCWLTEEKTVVPLPACQSTGALPSGEQPPPARFFIHPCACTAALLQVAMHITAAVMAATTVSSANTAQQSNPRPQTKGWKWGLHHRGSRRTASTNPAWCRWRHLTQHRIRGLTFHLAFGISAFVSWQSRSSGNDSVCNALHHKH